MLNKKFIIGINIIWHELFCCNNIIIIIIIISYNNITYYIITNFIISFCAIFYLVISN